MRPSNPTKAVNDSRKGPATTSNGVQFHQNYGYEDFIVGIKAKPERTIDLRRHTRHLPANGSRGQPTPKPDNYYLIIDEITEVLSRIFGELILSLEYRDLEVYLPGQSEPLVIPKNLYLIGTMNTADRNIARLTTSSTSFLDAGTAPRHRRPSQLRLSVH